MWIDIALRVYFGGGVITAFVFNNTCSRSGNIGDALIPIFAIAMGAMWPALAIGGIGSAVVGAANGLYHLASNRRR